MDWSAAGKAHQCGQYGSGGGEPPSVAERGNGVSGVGTGVEDGDQDGTEHGSELAGHGDDGGAGGETGRAKGG
jgi:hypothetical protein